MDARKPPRLMDSVRAALRAGHYSHLTERSYVAWIRRFILFNGKRHPKDLGVPEIEAFLTSLAVERKVSSSTQNQALNAILFLYSRVLEIQLPWLNGVVRTKKAARLPVVLTVEEVAAVLANLEGVYWLIASLLYGSGLRLMECMRLRVKDIEIPLRQITVRDGKGRKDRVTMLPNAVVPALEQHLERRKERHALDRSRGGGAVYIMWRVLVRRAPRARSTDKPLLAETRAGVSPGS